MMPTLYHWEPNAGSLEVLIALYEKEIPFKSAYVDLLDMEMWRQPFRGRTEVDFNIEIEGPVLVADTIAMTDAYFINLYLDDAFPERPLRPADAAGRWRINVWGRHIGEDLAPAVNALGCAKYLTAKLKARDEAALKRAIGELPTQERRDSWLAALSGYDEAQLEDARRKIGLILARAEAALANAPYLLGEAVSLADLTLFAQANSLPKLAPDILATAPRTGAWLERMRGRAGVKAALKLARTAAPEEAFAPGPEPSRWG